MRNSQLLWEEPRSAQVLSLSGGERVTLYEDHGDHLEAVRAIVLGQTSTGTYVGEFEDGSRSEFFAEDIAEVEVPSHSMGGFWDAFRSKKGFEKFEEPGKEGSGALIPAQPPPPQEGGLLAPFKGFFGGMTEPPEDIAQKSILEVFQPPELGPSILMPFVERAASIIPPEDAPGILAPFVESAESIMLPQGAPGMLAPYVERAMEPFQHVQPSPPREPWEVTEAKQKELWEGMFEADPETPQEIVPIFEPPPGRPERAGARPYTGPAQKVSIKPFTRKEALGEEVYPVPPTIDEIWFGQTDFKVLPLPPRPASQIFPDVIDVARGLVTFWKRRDVSIDELMDDIREIVSSKDWQKELEENGCAEYPFEGLTTGDADPYGLEAVALWLQIPWKTIEKIGGEAIEGEEEDWSEVNDEITYPGRQLILEAMNIIKPADLPGNFTFVDANHNGSDVLAYVEGIGICAQEGCPRPDMGMDWDCFEGVEGRKGRVRGAFGEYAGSEEEGEEEGEGEGEEEEGEEEEEEAPKPKKKPAKKKKKAAKRKKK